MSTKNVFEPPPESPLSLGDLIGRGFRNFRANGKLCFQKLFWPSVLTSASVAGAKWCFLKWVESRSLNPNVVIVFTSGIFIAMVCLVIAQWIYTLRSMAIARMALLGGITFDEAYQYAQEHKWTAFGLYNGGVLVPLLVAIFWMVAAIGALLLAELKGVFPALLPVMLGLIGLLATVTIAWSILYTSLLFIVLSAENLSLAQVFKRAQDLTFPYLWRGGSFICLLGICLIGVACALELPMIVIAMVEMIVRGAARGTAPYEVPAYIQILGAACDTLASIVIVAVAIICDAMYYNDIRLRLEGWDLMKKLEKLSG